ncbi:hypothetical protein DFH29DRAFT_1053710 [Suillus ampliporus]|nr:hypothetical protein DFH29DRAFT_1053710 [Suillus ampliporus]
MLELCPLGHQHRPRTFNELSQALDACFTQCGSIDNLDENMQLRYVISMCPEDDTYLNNLAFSIKLRFDHQGKSHDLNEVITLLALDKVNRAQGKAVLTAVDDELVHKLVPPNVKFTTLSGGDATPAGALDALRRNTPVHLACHGKQDREQPYNSHFAMRDEPLTLLDIMENLMLRKLNLPGLQFLGFKSVIGTLWGVDDALARHVVDAFYKNMFKKKGVIDCTRAASALNHATNAVKKKHLREGQGQCGEIFALD